MPTSLAQVKELHRVFNVPIHDDPHISDEKINQLRIALLQEELNELKDALGVPKNWWERVKHFFGFHKQRSKIEAFDALTDIQYVLDGAYVSLGYWRWKRKGIAEVQRANMSKLGEDGKPIMRADGKFLKGPNYAPPNLVPILLGAPDDTAQ